MPVIPRFTSSDLALIPDDGKCYEVIDGDLVVTHQTSWNHQNHQYVASRLCCFLDESSDLSKRVHLNCAVSIYA